jgi:hypothetical protein
MGQKIISMPVAVTLLALVVLVAGFFLYKGVTGGTVGDGREGHVQASPPMPEAAKQQMIQQHSAPNGGGGIRP